MQNTGSNIILSLVSALALALFVTDMWLTFRDWEYSQLIKDYECGYYGDRPCELGLNGDGLTGRIEIKYRGDAQAELPPCLAPSVVPGAQTSNIGMQRTRN